MAVDLGVEQPKRTAPRALHPPARLRRPFSAGVAWLARRHSLPVELGLVTVLYAAYDTSRGAAMSGVGAAVAHARDLYAIERSLGVAIEPAVQRAAMRVPGLTVVFGISYMVLHLLATGAMLLWLHRTRAEAYVRMRLALLTASVLSLVGFVVWPTAPPRLAGLGIVGTLSRAGVAMNSPTLTVLYNPYAAFPSLHMAYAALTGYALWRYARRRWVRAVGAALPAWVVVEVVATGNHFLLDVAAGLAVSAVGLVLAHATVTANRQTSRPQATPHLSDPTPSRTTPSGRSDRTARDPA